MVISGCSAKRATVQQLQQQLDEVDKDLTSRLQTIDSNCSRMTVCRLFYRSAVLNICSLQLLSTDTHPAYSSGCDSTGLAEWKPFLQCSY